MASLASVDWESVGVDEFDRLASEYGTPFYLYDADAVCDRIRAVRRSLGDRVRVYYAVKANPNLELLKSLKHTADGLDISSSGELEQALAAGYDPCRMSFAGPAKSVDELTLAVRSGVGNISVESLRELHDCIDVSRTLGTRAHIVIRVNPKFLNRSFGLKMGGRPVQFGIDEEVLGEALSVVAANDDNLEFHGIHIYAGSQCFDGAAIIEGVQNTFRIVREIENSSGLRCRAVNLGGGFGISHSKDGEELDIVAMAPDLELVIRQFQEASGFEREVVFELGRFLTADAGLYVCRVISSKESRGKRFYAVDGGLHHHLSAAGTFGTALRSNFVLRNLTGPGRDPVQCNIAGPSCNPTDLLGVNVTVPEFRHGDLVGVLKSGSYGLTASPLLFLGRRSPAELVREGGKVRLGRPARGILEFN